MTKPTLTIDIDAVAQNWRDLDHMSASHVQTAAVVKANAYGLGLGPVVHKLAAEGVQTFFVATAHEGAALRQALGISRIINLFCGHMTGDSDLIRDHQLTPMLNAPDQITRHLTDLPGHPFGVQLDSGMHRLGLQPTDWAELRDTALAAKPNLIMSHLACADEPDHPMNAQQLATFRQQTKDLTIPRSLAATGGILLGGDYHFDLTRPGVGLYGGLPFAQASATVSLSVPVIQTRTLKPGDSVGYGNTWIASQNTRVATVSAGYADGLPRSLAPGTVFYHGATPCPVIGRISMDLITVDITQLETAPTALDILCPQQSVDQLAEAAGTIGYEILTSLGPRYERRYKGAP